MNHLLEVDLSILIKDKPFFQLEDRSGRTRSEVKVDAVLFDIEPCGFRIFRVEEL